MKSNAKKLTAVLLLIGMLCAFLSGCNAGGGAVSTTSLTASTASSSSSGTSASSTSGTESGSYTSSAPQTGKEPALTAALTINAEYQIVCKKSDAMLQLAGLVQSGIAAATGVTLPIVSPTLSDPKVTAKEIVVGDVVALSDGLRAGLTRTTDYSILEYAIMVKEDRVLLNGGSNDALAYALSRLLTDYTVGEVVEIPRSLALQTQIPPTVLPLKHASASVLLQNASMSATGVDMHSPNAMLAMKLVDVMGEIKLCFYANASATFQIYVDRVMRGTLVVPAGERTEKSIYTATQKADHEVMLVKTAGTGDCQITDLSVVGSMGEKPTETSATLQASGNSSAFKILGRGYDTGYGITCDYSGAGFDFNIFTMSGTDVKAKFASTAANGYNGDTYFTVYIDGVKQDRLHVACSNYKTDAPAYTEVTLAIGLAPGLHNIRLVRQSNVWHSYCALSTLTFSGALATPPQNKAKYIEFIGDSITCGYGVISGCPKSGSDCGTAKWCDATQTYAYLTAEALDADFALCGYSGWGLCSGTQSMGYIPGVYVKRHYERAGGAEPYSFARKPDLIVVKVGGNDADAGETDNSYYDDALAFLRLLREKNGPDVKIVWTYGAYTTKLSTAIKNALQAMGGESAGFYFCLLTANRDGGNGHPSAQGQQTNANELTAFIRSHVPGYGA